MTGVLLPNLSLPMPTKFLASPAKMLGGFGLVGGGITIPYHVSDLGRTGGHMAFTNHYHLAITRGIIDCYNELGTVIDCGEHPT